MLHTIRNRYAQHSIYTYSGIVLIAVNPFQRVTLYGPEIIQAYSGRRRGELEPHLFAIAEDAYTAMRKEGMGQTIIVSGERYGFINSRFKVTDLCPAVQVKQNRSISFCFSLAQCTYFPISRPSSSCVILHLSIHQIRMLSQRPNSLWTIQVKSNVRYWQRIPFSRLLEMQKLLGTTIHLASENISR